MTIPDPKEHEHKIQRVVWYLRDKYDNQFSRDEIVAVLSHFQEELEKSKELGDFITKSCYPDYRVHLDSCFDDLTLTYLSIGTHLNVSLLEILLDDEESKKKVLDTIEDDIYKYFNGK